MATGKFSSISDDSSIVSDKSVDSFSMSSVFDRGSEVSGQDI